MMKKLLFLIAFTCVFLTYPIGSSIAQEAGGQGTSSAIEDEFADDDMDFLDEEEDDQVAVAPISDPFEGFNRGMFVVNDKLYFYCLKPAAQGYKAVTPGFFRRGVRNFFRNVETPIRLVNCLLQGKGKKAGTEALRFLVNTTVGFGGLGDPATKHHEMIRQDEDFGQTLAVWGVDSGPYFVWPILGPYSLRHTGGYVLDTPLNPRTYIPQWETSLMVFAGKTINNTTFRIGDYEALKDAAVDPYEAVRDAYTQYRQKLIDK